MSLEQDMKYECSWCGIPLEADQVGRGVCSDECAEKDFYGDCASTADGEAVEQGGNGLKPDSR